MKLGIITSSYPLSPEDTVNAGVFVRDLALELHKNGHSVYILTPMKYGKKELDPSVPVQFIEWWGGEKDLASVSMRNPLNLLRYATLMWNGIWASLQFSKKNGLDATLAMWVIPSGIFSLWIKKRLGIPFGVWALGSDIWARHKYPFGPQLVKMVLEEADFRFADGVKLAEDVQTICGKKTQFVPSVRKLNPKNSTHLSTLPGSPRFLFIGRYELNKGPDFLIQAMNSYINQGGKGHLYVFGTGSLESGLRDLAKGNTAQIHIGGIATPDQVAAYMKACDYLVIPSRIESIPLILIDAIQMGIPVIATRVGDMGKILSDYNIGIPIEPLDVPGLVEVFHACETKKITEADWISARKRFSLEQSARDCLLHLEDAIQKNRALSA